MTIQHKDIETPQRHEIKGFEEAPVNTFHTKNTQGNTEWVNLDTLGGNPASHSTRHLPETGEDKLPTVEPQTVGEANAVGNSNNFVRGDHVHAHGDQTLGSHHETATDAKHGFMSKENKTKLDTIETNAKDDQTAVEIKSLYESNANTNEFSDAYETKLNGIEANATQDQTAAEIKTAYESNTNTNEFSDSEKTKLSNIEAGGEVNQTDAEIKAQYEANANTNEFDDVEKSKLGGIENNATADQSDAEIKAAYENNANTNEFTDIEKNKLSNIEALSEANQTDAEIKVQYENNSNTNGFTDAEKSKLAALETSKFLGEYASLTALQSAHPSPVVGSYGNVDLGVGQNVTKYLWDNDDNIYVAQLGDSTILTDAQIKTQYENNADTNAYTDAEKSKLSFIEANAEVNQTNAEIKVQYEANSNTNAYDDAAVTKLATIETGAEVNPDNLEIKAQYEVNPNTNAFTDAALAKVNSVETGAEVNQTNAEIKAQYEANADTNAFEDADEAKLDGIEALAEVNQTNAEIKVQYEANADTNAFEDADEAKLDGIEDNATRDQTAVEIKTLYESNANTNEYDDTEQYIVSKTEQGWLQYGSSTNITSSANYPAYTLIPVTVNYDSYPNGFLTKVTNNQFRADFLGHVEVNVKATGRITNNNDRAWIIGVLKNGIIVPQAKFQAAGKDDANREQGCSGSVKIACNVSDVFQFYLSNREGGNSATLLADEIVLSVTSIQRT